MASMTMTASFLAGTTVARQPVTAPRRGVVVAKASRTTEEESVNMEIKNGEKSSNGRRDLMFASAAAAAAAAFSIGKVAMADEPRRGSAEAKKKYYPVCVANPTARICRN